jgi:type IV pilus assembly protein PilX
MTAVETPLARTCVAQRRVARSRQRGISLVTTLLLMLGTLGLGVAVMNVNVMEERMIGNTKDRDLALQAAEAALRDGEQDVATNISSASAFADDCTNGLCTPPAQRSAQGNLASLPVQDARLGFDWARDATVRRYGQYTGSAPFPSVAQQPRYVIEKFSYLGTPAGESVVLGAEPAAPGVGYRITARGVGARAETVVLLQSIYATR